MLNTFTNAKTVRFGSGSVIIRSKNGDDLEDDYIAENAPSIFAGDKHESRSERYTYIPTINVLRGLRTEGFFVTEVRQGGSRDEEKRGFTKHMVRLRHQSQASDIVGGDSVRELILVNSHDGTSSYQLMSGLFRMVCTNGLIACENGEMQRIPHKGDIIGNVIEGAYQIIENSRDISESVRELQHVQINESEQLAFAKASLQLRYNAKDDEGRIKPAPIAAESLLATRRSADAGNDLWKTFNRVQENLMRGGQGYTHRAENGRRSHRQTRPVNSIDGNVSINRALWTLAEEMRKIKSAA